MEAAEAVKCGACQFWSPTLAGCVSVPLKYDCQGDLGVPGLMGCGVECAYYEEDGEHGEKERGREGEREGEKERASDDGVGGGGGEGAKPFPTHTRAHAPPLFPPHTLPHLWPPPPQPPHPTGHCVDIDRDECTAITADQYDKDIAALVIKRDAGEIPAGELRLLPPLPPQVQAAAEEVEEEP